MHTIVLLTVALVLIPLAVAITTVFTPHRYALFMARIHVGTALGSLAIAAVIFPSFREVDTSILYLDDLSRIFLILIAIIFAIISVYAIPYFRREIENGTIGTVKLKEYLIYVHLFAVSMLLVTVTRNLIIMWIGMEATTISTIFLISFYGKHRNWESAWKYLVICGTGITLGLFGILTLLYAMGGGKDFINFTYFTHLPTDFVGNIQLVKLGFLIAFVGFATKVGIVPMHTWVPDTYSKAPSPASAIMSSILTPLALYMLLRIKAITDIVLGNTTFTGNIFIFFGILTLLYCGTILLQQFHYKRTLAYSSSENMGIAMIAFGFSGYHPIFFFLGIAHIIAHAFIKQGAFMTVGNIIINYESGNYKNISDLPRFMKYTSLFLVFFIAMLAGIPPSPLFFTELGLVYGVFTISPIVALLMIFGLVLAFTGLLLNFAKLFSEKEVIKIPFDRVRTEDRLDLWHATLIVVTLFVLSSFAFVPALYSIFVK